MKNTYSSTWHIFSHQSDQVVSFCTIEYSIKSNEQGFQNIYAQLFISYSYSAIPSKHKINNNSTETSFYHLYLLFQLDVTDITDMQDLRMSQISSIMASRYLIRADNSRNPSGSWLVDIFSPSQIMLDHGVGQRYRNQKVITHIIKYHHWYVFYFWRTVKGLYNGTLREATNETR